MNLIEQARLAWSQGDLGKAHDLAVGAFNENRTPDNVCLAASIMHHMGRSSEARNLLRAIVIEMPSFLPAQTQLARMLKMDARAASDAAKQENAQRRAILAAMADTLERDPFFKPSIFWAAIAAKHERMLDDFGIGNFKRTVAHNYQNWLINNAQDPQWLRLRKIWQGEPTDQPLLNTIEDLDDAGFIWEINSPVYPLSNPNCLAVYKIATGILWEYALKRDTCGFLKGFEESPVGNPIRLRRDGIVISQDAAHSSRELNALYAAVPAAATENLTFAELGAGQGRLAEMIGRSSKHRFMIFDIPPTLYVSQWYIQQLFPNEKIFTFRDFDSWDAVKDEVNNSRFAFFTPNQIKHLPANSIDIFINICSLMEMNKAQIAYFLERIAEVTRRTFMSKQYYQWKNQADNILLTKNDFGLPHGFNVVSDEADDIHDGLFVQMWQKK